MVPTIYTTTANKTLSTNQYSVTEHFRPSDVMGGHNLPGIFFFYDLSPIKARPQAFAHAWACRPGHGCAMTATRWPLPARELASACQICMTALLCASLPAGAVLVPMPAATPAGAQD